MNDTSKTRRYALSGGYERWNGAVSRAFNGRRPKERILLLLRIFVHFLIATAFSGATLPYTEMSVGAPLADALLCSVGAGALGVYVGAIYGAVLTKSISFSRIFALTFITVLRFAVSALIREKKGGILRESVLIKVGYSAVMALVQCALYLTASGIHGDVWVRLLATVIALPILTAVFAVFFVGCPKSSAHVGGYVERALYELSLTAFFAATVYSLIGIRYFGVSTASLAALLLTLFAASRGGAVRGAVIGGILGLICSPSTALSYAVVGGASGIFYCLGVLPAAGISAFAGASVALLQVGYTAFAGFIPEAVISVAVASPIIRYSLLPERFPYPKNELPEEYAEVGEAERRALGIVNKNRELIRLSETLNDISAEIAGKGNDPTLKTTERICESLSKSFCDSCALSSICWESEAKRSESSVKSIISAMKDGAKAPHGDGHLSGYCIRFKELSGEITRLYGMGNEGSVEVPTYGSAASELRTVAKMISDIADSARREDTRDTEAENAVMSAAEAVGFDTRALTVSGAERKRIYAYGVKGEMSPEEGEKIRRAFSEACKTEYGYPVPSNDSSDCMVFSPKKTLSARTYCLKSTKDGEKCSGDSVLTSETEDGYFYAALADGMGSGEAARRASASALSMLERLLKCKIKKSTATELVGDILKRRNEECFTTVDIMELDLVCGEASFLKSGAAASYVVRNGGVYCVSALSMPVGITEEAHPEEISFKLRDGDTVIMLSDGIAVDAADGKWISETVCVDFRSEKELCELIMKNAEKRSAQVDDKTVLVISVGRFCEEANAKEA